MAFVRDTNVLTPMMTSNTAPSGIASTTSTYDALSDAWRAFNGTLTNSADQWSTAAGVTAATLGYQFSTAKIANGYNLYSQLSAPGRAPKNWTFEGSNDGTSWTVLHTVTNKTVWSDSVKVNYSFFNLNSYTRYRLNITAGNGTFVSLGEFEIIYAVTNRQQAMTGGM